MDPLEKVRDRLRSSGHFVTDSRRTLIQYLLESEQSPRTPQEIHENVKKTGMDRSTVYRTINLFIELDILNQIQFRDGVKRVELSHDFGGSHHHHLVCERCGEILEFEECGLNTVQRLAEAKHQFDVQDHQLEFFGLCHRCKEEAA